MILWTHIIREGELAEHSLEQVAGETQHSAYQTPTHQTWAALTDLVNIRILSSDTIVSGATSDSDH